MHEVIFSPSLLTPAAWHFTENKGNENRDKVLYDSITVKEGRFRKNKFNCNQMQPTTCMLNFVHDMHPLNPVS